MRFSPSDSTVTSFLRPNFVWQFSPYHSETWVDTIGNFWCFLCNISKTVIVYYLIGRKLHTSLQLVLISLTFSVTDAVHIVMEYPITSAHVSGSSKTLYIQILSSLFNWLWTMKYVWTLRVHLFCRWWTLNTSSIIATCYSDVGSVYGCTELLTYLLTWCVFNTVMGPRLPHFNSLVTISDLQHYPI